MTAVDTAKVQGRRTLHFERLEDIRADVDRLAQAQEVKHLGNWSAGQVLKHVAMIMTCSLDGFRARPPWYFRLMFLFMRPFMKSKFLRDPMPAGFKMPSFAAAEMNPPASTWNEGLAAIREALHRLQTEPQRAPSPFMGNLTSDQWTQLHCRHSELHLSFLVPQE
jgi:hypothetical protein